MTPKPDDGNPGLEAGPVFPALPAFPAFWPLWEQAERGLARLESRLQALPPASPVRAGWQERALLAESVGSAALEGAYLEGDRLALWELDADGAPPDGALGVGLGILRALRALAREGVAASDSAEGIHALHQRCCGGGRRPLSPDENRRLAFWQRWLDGPLAAAPALPAAALALAGWHGGVGLRHGGGSGRCLVNAFLWRRGVMSGPWLPLARGFAALPLSAYRPQGPDTALWLDVFLRAMLLGVERAEQELAGLLRLEARLTAPSQTRRRHSRLPQVGALLLAAPAVSPGTVARHLGLSRRGAVLLLEELVRCGIAEEASGRERFRVYRAARG